MVKLKNSAKPLEPLKQIAKDIVQINLADEMQQSYLEYSLANLGRTLPNFSDGLIPVQRRILFAANTAGFSSSKKFTKCARLTGEVSGRLHPHGDCYGALITMSNTWNNNIPLMDFHGSNSTATSNAAASRYTETKLNLFSERVLLQELETVDSKPNYDNTLQEPIALNARIPNLLVFGQTGISVGFATNCLSHNINEVINSTIKYVETNGKCATKLVPDFKQGCEIIVSKETLQQYSDTGRATFKLRAKLVSCETVKEKRTSLTSYTFENIPYGANVEKIGDQLKKALETGRHGDLQIRHIEDASDRTGDRLIVTSKRDDVLELLYLASDLQTTVSANNYVLNPQNIPQLVSASELIEMWLANRKKQVVKWAEYRIAKLSARLHIVEGYLLLLASKIKAIKAIQDAETVEIAKQALIDKFGLSDLQASAVLELKLKQITKLNAVEFENEKAELEAEIALERSHAKSPAELIVEQLKEIKKEFGQKRNCEIKIETEASLMAKADMVQSSAANNAASHPSKKITFFSLNTAKGIVESGANKSCFVAETTDKIVAIAEDGLLYKFSAAHRGPITDKPLKILWCEKESKCRESGLYIELLAKESGSKGRLVGKALKISDLVSATSKGSYIGFRPDKNLDFRVAKSGVERDELQTKISLKHHKFSFIV